MRLRSTFATRIRPSHKCDQIVEAGKSWEPEIIPYWHEWNQQWNTGSPVPFRLSISVIDWNTWLNIRTVCIEQQHHPYSRNLSRCCTAINRSWKSNIKNNITKGIERLKLCNEYGVARFINRTIMIPDDGAKAMRGISIRGRSERLLCTGEMVKRWKKFPEEPRERMAQQQPILLLGLRAGVSFVHAGVGRCARLPAMNRLPRIKSVDNAGFMDVGSRLRESWPAWWQRK